MKLQTLSRTSGVAAAALLLSAGLAACGSDDDGPGATDSSASAETSESGDPMGEEADPATQAFGPACDQIPSDGAGSFSGMVQDPVATAASTNPLLKTLTAAVGAVEGLGDNLNGAEALTVFAPYDPAFEELGSDTVNTLVEEAQQKGADSTLATVLGYHVLAGQLDPAAVVGDQETLQGGTVTVEGGEDGMTVNGATVLCGNIPTANATVYVIDQVLMPEG